MLSTDCGQVRGGENHPPGLVNVLLRKSNWRIGQYATTLWFVVLGFSAQHRDRPGTANDSTVTPGERLIGHPDVGGTAVVTLTWVESVGGCSPSNYVLQAGPTLEDAAEVVVPASSCFTAHNVPAGTYDVRLRSITAGQRSASSNEVVVRISTNFDVAPR